MAMLRIELGEENPGYPCPCCGAECQRSYGLVYHDDDAHGVYLAGWSEGHRAEGVRLAISIGDYAEGSGPGDRLAVGLRATLTGRRVEFHVVSPEASPFQDCADLGPMLPQAEALTHPHLQAFLDVAQAAVRDDPRLRSYLEATRR